MFALVLSTIVFPQQVSLDGITVERARTLHGKLVVASFLVAKPNYTLRSQTMIGAADHEDGVERGAVLKGNRLDIEMGLQTHVIGRLRVIDHPPALVNGRFVPAWVEIRVEQ